MNNLNNIYRFINCSFIHVLQFKSLFRSYKEMKGFDLIKEGIIHDCLYLIKEWPFKDFIIKWFVKMT